MLLARAIWGPNGQIVKLVSASNRVFDEEQDFDAVHVPHYNSPKCKGGFMEKISCDIFFDYT
jgi:hypothetical protein